MTSHSMTNIRPSRHLLILAAAGFVFSTVVSHAQVPAGGAASTTPAAPAGGGRGGRGGLPGATPEQTQAVADMNTALAALTTAVTTARTEMATVTLADVRNVAGITSAGTKLRAAELALAMKRADEFAKLQAGPTKLNADQIAALIAAGGNPAAGGGGRGGGGAAAPPPAAPSAGRGN